MSGVSATEGANQRQRQDLISLKKKKSYTGSLGEPSSMASILVGWGQSMAVLLDRVPKPSRSRSWTQHPCEGCNNAPPTATHNLQWLQDKGSPGKSQTRKIRELIPSNY